jgi:hypothetical protein
MNIQRNALLGLMAVAIGAGAVSAASADPLTHPRRAEVSARLERQNDRVDRARFEGRISGGEAWRMHRADYRVRRQEVRFARFHRGHISRFEQHRLNREENRISRHIG